MHIGKYLNVRFLFAALILIGILVFFSTRGITFYDEGYILNSALKVAHGQIPYRDFDTLYTPLTYITTAASFKILGESVLSERIAAISIFVLSLYGLYKILTLVTKNSFIIFIALLFYTFWGPAHINFMWPTMLAACFFLYTAFFYLKGYMENNTINFFLSGIMVVLIFFAKQNFGIGIFSVPFLLLPLLDKQRISSLAYYLLGLFSSLALVFLLLLSTHALIPFINNFYFFTIEKILFNHILDTPFLYGSSFVIKFAKALLYLFPLIISVIAFYVMYKKQNKLYILPVFTSIFYIMGIRPTTDYDHLVPLLAISSISIVIVIQTISHKMIRQAFIVLFILFTILGFYTAYYSSYYKWNTRLQRNTTFVSNPRLHIYLDSTTANDSIRLVNYIDSYTKPTDHIFVNFDASFIYFLTNRQNISRIDYIANNAIPLNEQKYILGKIQQGKVKIVIMNNLNISEKSLIANYVRRHSHIEKTIDGYILYYF